jgi:hypothetical protein
MTIVWTKEQLARTADWAKQKQATASSPTVGTGSCLGWELLDISVECGKHLVYHLSCPQNVYKKTSFGA